MKVQVCTTIKSGGETVFWLSLLNAIKEGAVTAFNLTEGDTPVGRSRNNLTRDFLKTDNDALLWIDSDLEFKPWHIRCLLEHDLPIVAGVYPLKRKELAWCLNSVANGQTEQTGILQEVKYVGTGFMLIKREVFEKIAKAYPELRYIEDDQKREPVHNFWRMEVGFDSDLGINRWLSEDWWFCEMWRRLGGKVFVDRRVTLKHYGMIAYPLDQSVLVPTPDQGPAVDMVCPDNMQPGIRQIMAGEYDVEGLGEVNTVLDVGANIGGFTLWASKRWPGAMIHCYEPAEDNVALWKQNCKSIDGVATLTTAAVTSHPGPVKLFKGTANGFLHSLVDIGHQRMNEFFEVPAVNPATLPKCDFVKVDTEGSEVDILTGLDLSETKGLSVEWHSVADRAQIPAMLSARGFQLLNDTQHGPYYGVQKFIRSTLLASTVSSDASGKPGPQPLSETVPPIPV